MIFVQLLSGFFIQVMPFAVLAIYPCSGHLRFSGKKTAWMTVGLVFGLSAVFALSGCFLYSRVLHGDELFYAVNVVFLCCLLPCFFYFSYVVRISWREKIFVFSFLLTSALALTSICNIIVSWFYKDRYGNGLPYNGITPLIILGFNLVGLPVLLFLLKHGYMPVSDSLSKKENGYLAGLSLSLFLILGSGLIFMDYSNIYNATAIFLYVALFLMVFVIYFIFFRMLDLAHGKLTEQQNNLKLKHQLEIRNEQYLRFNENIEGSRRMRHDLKHHMLILRGYLNDGEIAKAEEYLNRRIYDVETYEIAKISDIPVIDWILNYYQAQAREKGVALNIHISNLPPNIEVISDADFAVLFGNLLENAVMAAADEGVRERFICLNICCLGKMLVITVDNSFNGRVRRSGEQYLSTKEGHGGIGLQSIKMIADKYDGGVEFSNEAEVFHSSVMLNVSQAGIPADGKEGLS